MKNSTLYKLVFASVYPHYLAKVEKKGHTKDKLDTIIKWLAGYDQKGLEAQLERKVDIETFFAEAPLLNPNASLITGVICGYRVEEIEDPVLRKVRYLDKMIDELYKGKAMEKILRK